MQSDAKPRILIVEDESIVAIDIEASLKSGGYDVVGIADSGDDALALVQSKRPDLVLMDIRLQGKLSGIDVAKRILERDHLPVIYLTAHSDEQTLRQAMLTQPYGYLLKPFGQYELRAAIETALYKAQTEAALRASEEALRLAKNDLEVKVQERTRELQAANEQLEASNTEMGQFVYTVSHDLKSPLVTITGFLALLKEDIEAKRYDKVADSILRLERANARMGQLIDDLLQLSRIGRLTLEREEIDISLLLRGLLENLVQQIKEKNISVSIQEPLSRVYGDRKQIYQAFENIIINAIKYASDAANPEVFIGGSCTAQGEVRYFVKDSGPGIAPEYHQKIFGLFQRLESDKRGTGIGLAIVARIMQRHAGKAWVESELGKGAVFWLAFPTS